MKHASLFTGIGGFDLAAAWMGWENVFHCEINQFCQRILKHHFPQSISYHDIKTTDFTIHRGTIDILTGGFPCQPYSVAGKRKGKDDERHLWPEMLRAIREIQPRYIVGENVSGIVSWNGGLVFDEVQTDMENEGYEVQAFILPACAKNAPHRRDRVWFIAHSNRFGNNNTVRAERDNGKQEGSLETGGRRRCETSGFSDERIITNTNQKRFCQTQQIRQWGRERFGFNSFGKLWEKFPTQSPICNGDDGLSTRLDGIAFPKWRNESIKAGGNAIVPQIAFEIFKAIKTLDEL